MIPLPLPIPARIVGAAGGRVGSGRGVVEKSGDGDTAVIRTGSGRVTVRLAAGRLTEGDLINIVRGRDGVLIHRVGSAPTDAVRGADTLRVATGHPGQSLPGVAELTGTINRLAANAPLVEQLEQTARMLEQVEGPGADRIGALAARTVLLVRNQSGTTLAVDERVVRELASVSRELSVALKDLAFEARAVGGATNGHSRELPEAGVHHFDSAERAVLWASRYVAFAPGAQREALAMMRAAGEDIRIMVVPGSDTAPTEPSLANEAIIRLGAASGEGASGTRQLFLLVGSEDLADSADRMAMTPARELGSQSMARQFDALVRVIQALPANTVNEIDLAVATARQALELVTRTGAGEETETVRQARGALGDLARVLRDLAPAAPPPPRDAATDDLVREFRSGDAALRWLEQRTAVPPETAARVRDVFGLSADSSAIRALLTQLEGARAVRDVPGYVVIDRFAAPGSSGAGSTVQVIIAARVESLAGALDALRADAGAVPASPEGREQLERAARILGSVSGPARESLRLAAAAIREVLAPRADPPTVKAGAEETRQLERALSDAAARLRELAETVRAGGNGGGAKPEAVVHHFRGADRAVAFLARFGPMSDDSVERIVRSGSTTGRPVEVSVPTEARPSESAIVRSQSPETVPRIAVAVPAGGSGAPAIQTSVRADAIGVAIAAAGERIMDPGTRAEALRALDALVTHLASSSAADTNGLRPLLEDIRPAIERAAAQPEPSQRDLHAVRDLASEIARRLEVVGRDAPAGATERLADSETPQRQGAPSPTVASLAERLTDPATRSETLRAVEAVVDRVEQVASREGAEAVTRAAELREAVARIAQEPQPRPEDLERVRQLLAQRGAPTDAQADQPSRTTDRRPEEAGEREEVRFVGESAARAWLDGQGGVDAEGREKIVELVRLLGDRIAFQRDEAPQLRVDLAQRGGEALLVERLELPVSTEAGPQATTVATVHGLQEIAEQLDAIVEQLESSPSAEGMKADMAAAVDLLRGTDASETSGLAPVLQQLDDALAQLSLSQSGELQEQAATLQREVSMLLKQGEPVAADTPPPAASPQAIPLDRMPEPGLYLFKSADRALLWLAGYRHGSADGTGGAERPMPEGEVVVRVGTDAAGSPRAQVLSPQSAALEIEHTLRSETRSATLQNLPSGVLQAALAQLGSLTDSRLAALDSLLAAYESSAPQAPSLSEQALRMTLPQVFGLAMNVPTELPASIGASLTEAGAEIPGLVESLFRMAQEMPAARGGPGPESFSFQQNMLQGGTIPREQVLPALFQGMGYNMEQALASAAATGGTPTETAEAESLKQALLAMIARLTEASESAKSDQARGADTGTRPQDSERQAPGGRLEQPEDETTERQAALRMSMPAIREQAESILSRLEGLQMLARPVPTSEGEQQVVVLPMRIGEEWTEVRVRFVKRGAKGAAGRDRRVCGLVLNVRPSFLGEITVRMEYRKGMALSMRMEFERPGAKRWFLKKDRELASALGSLGLGAVRMDMADTTSNQDRSKAGPTRREGRPGVLDMWG